ncbi:hypothetical protein GGER_14580 [Serratia rubidaea]
MPTPLAVPPGAIEFRAITPSAPDGSDVASKVILTLAFASQSNEISNGLFEVTLPIPENSVFLTVPIGTLMVGVVSVHVLAMIVASTLTKVA